MQLIKMLQEVRISNEVIPKGKEGRKERKGGREAKRKKRHEFYSIASSFLQ